MKIVKKKYFELSLESVQKIVNQLKQEYKDVEFRIWKSNTSTSVYVRINYRDRVRLVRIADHTSNATAKTVLVTPSTRFSKVYNTLNSTVKSLQKWETKELIQSIENFNKEQQEAEKQ